MSWYRITNQREGVLLAVVDGPIRTKAEQICKHRRPLVHACTALETEAAMCQSSASPRTVGDRRRRSRRALLHHFPSNFEARFFQARRRIAGSGTDA